MNDLQIKDQNIKSEHTETEKEETTECHKEAHIDVPDGGYGWFVVMGSFFLNFATWGANAGYSTYLAYYLQNNKFVGATKLDYAAIGGLAFGCGSIMAPLIRLLVNNVGVRVTITVGAMLQFLGTMLAAFSAKLWQIYLTQGLLIGWGLGLNFIPSLTVLTPWFRKKRSLAASIGSAGSGVGGVIFNLGVQAMIKNLGLRWASIIQSIICAVCNVIGISLIRPRDKHVQVVMKSWDCAILRIPVYWLYVFYLSSTLLGYVCLLYSLADFTLSLGYSSHQASVVACMISLGNFFGRPLVGRLADRFGPVSTSVVVHSIVGILSFAMWIPARNYATAIAFGFLEGSMMGTIWVVIASIGARVVGLRKVDVALSMAWVFMSSFSTISPLISIELRGAAPHDQLYDPTQYRDPAIYCGCVYISSAFALWFIRGYLIARDRIAVELGSHEDNEESEIHVTVGETLRGLFALSKTRKV